jgi:hypothetical protein
MKESDPGIQLVARIDERINWKIRGRKGREIDRQVSPK